MVSYFRRGFGAIVMTGRSDHLAIRIAAGAAGDRDLGDRDSDQRLQFQVPLAAPECAVAPDGRWHPWHGRGLRDGRGGFGSWRWRPSSLSDHHDQSSSLQESAVPGQSRWVGAWAMIMVILTTEVWMRMIVRESQAPSHCGSNCSDSPRRLGLGVS